MEPDRLMLGTSKVSAAARLASASQVTPRRASCTVRPSALAVSVEVSATGDLDWAAAADDGVLRTCLHAATSCWSIFGKGKEAGRFGIWPSTSGLKQSRTRRSPMG